MASLRETFAERQPQAQRPESAQQTFLVSLPRTPCDDATLQLCKNPQYVDMITSKVQRGDATCSELAIYNGHIKHQTSSASAMQTAEHRLPFNNESDELLDHEDKRRRERCSAGTAQLKQAADNDGQAFDERRERALLEYQHRLRLLLHKDERRQAARRLEQQRQRFTPATKDNAELYSRPFCEFLSRNPTVFHAVAALRRDLKKAGFTELSERESWDIKRSGSYFVERNGSALIAFTVGAKYELGNGAAVLGGHVDALTAKLKPVSKVPNKAGYLQLGVAPYAGGMNSTWWDRDLGIAGRVHLKKNNGKIVTELVNIDRPIARIPTLAPHFGAASQGPFNQETQMVPIIGLDSSPSFEKTAPAEPFSQPPLLGSASGLGTSFVSTQPPALVEAIKNQLRECWSPNADDEMDEDDETEIDGLENYDMGEIVNWELELYDVQPAVRGGLSEELIYGGRIDDKLCSWSALQALIEAKNADRDSSILKVVGLFDDEEIGSLLRQGARGNFLPSVIERAVGSLADHKPTSDLMGRTYANSFLVSSDVTHAVNPNFLNAYLENHAPHLNVGIAIAADPNGHMTTDSVSTTIFQRCAEKAGAKLQVFQIRNDSRSGGTIGPMSSAMTGMRAIDAGLAQLSMHSIRATTGALDPGLGVITFKAFLNGFEEVDKEFR
jgi:aminopeptidase I